jgi:cysteine-S-conjugate beta-lyase
MLRNLRMGGSSSKTVSYNFDQPIDRRSSDSIKWRHYGDDVIPLWVADLDFRSPEPVIAALAERVAHGVFGYSIEPPELRPLIVDRLHRLYGWSIKPEWIVFLPGVVSGFNLACRAVTRPGEKLLFQTPVYPPIVTAHRHHDLEPAPMELTRGSDGYYSIDMEQFEQAIQPGTRLFILCNPHNPVGRCFTRTELFQMAEICLRHDVLICSDEIHCDLVYPEASHIPIASLSPEISAKSISLMAPSKTFNVAGLHCAYAIIEDDELRGRYRQAAAHLVSEPDLLSYAAAVAAYSGGGPWLEELLAYLQANRDHVVRHVRQRLPDVGIGVPEGTYLAWLDCRSLVPQIGDPFRFFLEQARVALGSGKGFGAGGDGFVRLNFGCTRATLETGLERMAAGLAR